MTLTRQQRINFYRNKKKVGTIIVDHVKKKKYIIFGSRSLNKQFPTYLDAQTEDYDILVKSNPKKAARGIERRLDKRFKGNYFETRPAAHPGTHKVISRVTKKGVADVSKQKKKVSTISRGKVRFSSLQHEKANIRRSLADPKSAFRHDKDRERLQRIKIFEAMKKKKRRIRRRSTIGKPLFEMPEMRFL